MADAANVKSEPLALDCYIEYPHHIEIPLKAHITGKFYEGDGLEPTTIVRCGTQCYVTVRIDFTGCELARLLCLKWCIKVAFESCGPGSEFVGGNRIVEQQVCSASYVEVTIPVSSPDECDKCGTVYFMCVTVTARDMCSKPVPFGGYCKGEQIMLYPGD